MRAYGVVLFLVASSIAAPQGEPSDAASEAKEPKARQLAYGQGEQLVFQAAPQFGAKLAQGVPAGAQVVYLQGGYQQPQYSYTPGQQQVAYIASAPAQQSYVVGAPAQYSAGALSQFSSGAPAQISTSAPAQFYSGSPAQISTSAPAQFYSGSSGYYTASAQVSQPQTNLVVKKTTVKPASYKVVTQPQVYKTQVTSFKAQAAPAPAVYYNPQPAPAVFKAPAAPAVFKVSAPAAAPAPVVKVSAAPAAAAVQYSSTAHAEPVHVIVKQFEDNNFDGSFNYNYETDHGISVESSGYLKNAGTEDEVQVIQGSYTYYSPEGVPITTTYIADENGFQVQGDHLPVAPPLPEAIAKSIAYQRSLPPSAEEQAAAAARQ